MVFKKQNRFTRHSFCSSGLLWKKKNKVINSLGVYLYVIDLIQRLEHQHNKNSQYSLNITTLIHRSVL